MTIFTRTRPRVKPTRTKPAAPHRFGEGLLPNYPTFAAPTGNLSDLAWWAAQEGERERLEAAMEQRARESRWERMIETVVRG